MSKLKGLEIKAILGAQIILISTYGQVLQKLGYDLIKVLRLSWLLCVNYLKIDYNFCTKTVLLKPQGLI